MTHKPTTRCDAPDAMGRHVDDWDACVVVSGENDTNIWSVKWADRPFSPFRNRLRRLAPRVRG